MYTIIFAIKVKKNKSGRVYKVMNFDELNFDVDETILTCNEKFTFNPEVALYIAKKEAEKVNAKVLIEFVDELAILPQKKEKNDGEVKE